MVADIPAGGSPDEILIPVTELAAIAGCSVVHYYRLARQGRAPLSRLGVPLPAAKTWLKARATAKAKKAATVRSLRALYDAASAKEGM